MFKYFQVNISFLMPDFQAVFELFQMNANKKILDMNHIAIVFNTIVLHGFEFYSIFFHENEIPFIFDSFYFVYDALQGTIRKSI